MSKLTAITGALSNIAGVDLFVHRDFPSTEADGKASATASNNTKGSALYVWRPAVQRGYGKNGLDITVYKIPGKDINSLVLWMQVLLSLTKSRWNRPSSSIMNKYILVK